MTSKKSQSQPFNFFPGQREYLARVACKDFALIAADTGCGKTLFALSLIQIKLGMPLNGRALIIAPQSTLRGDDVEEDDEAEEESTHTLSQWRAEVARFAPGVPVYEIYTWEDYQKLTTGHTPPPNGLYLSYFEGMLKNKGQERLPEKWDHARLCKAYQTGLGPTKLGFFCSYTDTAGCTVYNEATGVYEHQVKRGWMPEPERLFGLDADGLRGIKVGDVINVKPTKNEHTVVAVTVEKITETPIHDYTEGCGEEKGGIRCIASPCLATRIEMDYAVYRKPTDPKTAFEIICVDEAHAACHLSSQLSQSLIRMQAPVRLACTATPIPNICADMFVLMGWLCCPGWHAGKRRNAAWPYAREEIGRFVATFHSEERDYTQESMNSNKNRNWRGKCTKVSPVISSPARLLKLIKPTLAFISKEQCLAAITNSVEVGSKLVIATPTLQPCKVIDIRVPMGLRQAKLYQHYLNRANIPGKNALVRARTQVAYLRGVCADPKGRFGCASNFNPKTLTILEVVCDILKRGEQVLIVNARIGQTDEIARRLTEAGIAYGRIDSTVLAKNHNEQANLFKRGDVRVELMGAKCAKAFSFDNCANEIIGSLEYAYGVLHQTKGRVWRVNSKNPVTVYCILHKNSIEESQYDLVGLKADAATICLHGERVPRDFHPVDLSEVLADTITKFDGTGRDELDCEADWPQLCQALREASEGGSIQAPKPSPAPTPPRRPAWLTRMIETKTSTLVAA